MLLHWLSGRKFQPWYLVSPPVIWFFRYAEDIQIVWFADCIDDNIPVWTAKNGSCWMKYADFVWEWEDFGQRFFTAMEKQVRKAVDMDWGEVEIDKPGLWECHTKNREYFDRLIQRMKEPECDTDWDEVRDTIHRVFRGEYFN